MPHPPQLFGSVDVLTHVPEQSVSPAAHIVVVVVVEIRGRGCGTGSYLRPKITGPQREVAAYGREDVIEGHARNLGFSTVWRTSRAKSTVIGWRLMEA
jgi:hypothetical protein